MPQKMEITNPDPPGKYVQENGKGFTGQKTFRGTDEIPQTEMNPLKVSIPKFLPNCRIGSSVKNCPEIWRTRSQGEGG